ncbi:DUF2268 domain-containing protein [Halobacillus litoralis]|uniref:DUF2268 domain-containing protein n=1 Tax=Halobacillus litoralis TaxID=45668 RepID=UPI001CD2D65B|nr:DUF2268 domain-containing putative Zn-dependent protease [Halobacillus litoralis]MCA0971475.1 DUF2268 domain-containing protein [Halobacillus litoralis]
MKEFIEKCRKSPFQSTNKLQRDILCDPSRHPFSDRSSDELHDLLMMYGLFHSDQWRKTEKLLEEWETKKLFKQIHKEYIRLQKEWEGPDAPLYLYPIHQSFMGERDNRGGVAFQEGFYLFYSKPGKEGDWRSILAHEYHHVCRLNEKKVHLDKVPLKESVIIEGLAEYAVFDQYGPDYTADWVDHHTDEELSSIWEKRFKPELELSGQVNHGDYLYGNKRKKLPKWIGYELGYRIVKSYHDRHPDETIRSMTKRNAEQIIKGSSFSI